MNRIPGLASVCVLLLCACASPSSQKEEVFVSESYPAAGITYLHWDKGHGYQVTYYSERHVWLWYPGNRAALRGDWVQELVAGEYYLCFTYPHSSYNPVTGVVGGQKECQLQTVLGGALEGALAGDVYNLSSGRVPYVLRRNKRPAEF